MPIRQHSVSIHEQSDKTCQCMTPLAAHPTEKAQHRLHIFSKYPFLRPVCDSGASRGAHDETDRIYRIERTHRLVGHCQAELLRPPNHLARIVRLLVPIMFRAQE